jgi:hypothetical protein
VCATLLGVFLALSGPVNRWVVVGVSAGVLIFGAALNASYARGLCSSRSRRSKRRVADDHIVASELLGSSLIPVGVAVGAWLAGYEGPWTKAFDELLVLEPLIVAPYAICATALSSSLVDWYRIRPARDGLIGDPPCVTPDDLRWRLVTKAWFRHRLLAELAIFATSLAALLWFFLALLIEGGRDESSSRLIGGVGAAVVGVAAVALAARRGAYVQAFNKVIDGSGLRLGRQVRYACRRVVVKRTWLGLRGTEIYRSDVANSGYIRDVALQKVTLVRQVLDNEGSVSTDFFTGPSPIGVWDDSLEEDLTLFTTSGISIDPRALQVCRGHCTRINRFCERRHPEKELVPYACRGLGRVFVA